MIYWGRTHDQICPVTVILNYLVVRGTLRGPLFIFGDGTYLTCDNFTSAVRKALSAAGVDTSKYMGYSFRIGAPTMAAKLGIQDSLIRTMGDGRTLSTYFIFVLPERKSVWWHRHYSRTGKLGSDL